MDLRTYRKLASLTLAQMADKMGLPHESTVARHERGVRFPDPETIKKYSDITDGSVNYQDWVNVRDAFKAKKAKKKELAK